MGRQEPEKTGTYMEIPHSEPGMVHRIITGCLPARYIVAVLGGIGFAIIYGLKVNLSVAIVAMVNATVGSEMLNNATEMLTDVEECEAPTSSGGAEQEEGPFNWSASNQGIILGSYFWGYTLSQLPGGRLAEVLSAKWVLFSAVFINLVGTLLTPPAAYLHYSALLVMRVLEGVGAGVTFPAMHVMLAKWAPPQERLIISSIVYAGTALGTVISMVMSGWLISGLGWESVFYVMGSLSLMWCLLWAWLVQDSPAQQKYITSEEKKFIQTSLGQLDEVGGNKRKIPPVPLARVMTSGPFLALLITHVCSNVGWYMLLTQLPTYMKTILKFPIKENAGLSAVPYLCHWFFSLFWGKILDISRARDWLTITQARKLSTAIASVIPAVCLIGVGYVGCDRKLAVILMSVSIMSIGGMYSGFLSNHIDIAPNYAGTLMGISNTFASMPGFVVPYYVGYLTEGNQTIGQWRTVFFTVGVFYLIQVVVYTLFGSAVEQPWNKPTSRHDVIDDQEEQKLDKNTLDRLNEERELLSGDVVENGNGSTMSKL